MADVRHGCVVVHRYAGLVMAPFLPDLEMETARNFSVALM